MKKLIVILVFFITVTTAWSQNVGIGTTTPDASAVLDMTSNTKGALVPRLTTAQRTGISNPATGLLVFDTVEKTLYMFDGQNWLGFAALTNLQRPVNNYEYGPFPLQETTLMGYSVSMWDNFAAVGAPGVIVNGIYTGAVFIYQYVAGQWQFVNTIFPPTPNTNELFGTSVSLRGTNLVIGAPGLSIGATKPGGAYVYSYNGTSWVMSQLLSGTGLSTNFGETVAISQLGDVLAVSEPGATVGSSIPGAGKVYVFAKQGASFSLQQALQDPNPGSYEFFGTALAISPGGTHIIVGAPLKYSANILRNGYVGQFDKTGNSWAQTYTYTAPAQNNLLIGQSVDITDNNLIFSVGGTREVHFKNLALIGYSVILPDQIHSVSLDPVTQNMKVFSGNALYYIDASYNTAVKIKTFSADDIPTLPRLLSEYNNKTVIGIPKGANNAKPNQGVISFFE